MWWIKEYHVKNNTKRVEELFLKNIQNDWCVDCKKIVTSGIKNIKIHDSTRSWYLYEDNILVVNRSVIP